MGVFGPGGVPRANRSAKDLPHIGTGAPGRRARAIFDSAPRSKPRSIGVSVINCAGTAYTKLASPITSRKTTTKAINGKFGIFGNFNVLHITGHNVKFDDCLFDHQGNGLILYYDGVMVAAAEASVYKTIANTTELLSIIAAATSMERCRYP